MKKLIEKILFKYGFVPIREVRKAEISIHNQWKKIILDPKKLKFEQTIAKRERDFIKITEHAFLFGNGMMQVIRKATVGAKLCTT